MALLVVIYLILRLNFTTLESQPSGLLKTFLVYVASLQVKLPIVTYGIHAVRFVKNSFLWLKKGKDLATIDKRGWKLDSFILKKNITRSNKRSNKMNKDEIKKMMEEQIKVITEQRAAMIKKVHISDAIKIDIKDITKADVSVLEPIKVAKDKSIVYLIMLKNKPGNSTSSANIEKLFADKRKEAKNNWLVSDVNDFNWSLNSRCLYVGSSHGDILTRMKQHLAVGNLASRKTYSLWLKDWFGESSLPKEIEIYFLVFKDKSPDDVYRVEDLLWRSLSPLFGRSGKSPRSK